MTKNEILKRVRARAREIGRAPKSNDPKLGAVLVKEAYRKFGSWRLCLWLSGALKDERRKAGGKKVTKNLHKV